MGDIKFEHLTARPPATRFFAEIAIGLGGRPVALVVAGNERALTGVRFGAAADHAAWLGAASPDPTPLALAITQLHEYAAGRREQFEVAVQVSGSDFQVDVWRALADIPFGTTTSYGAVAGTVGRPGHARAVGSAVGANPIAVIIPCHRVVGATGALTGFGGGLDTKAALLAHEGITAV